MGDPHRRQRGSVLSGVLIVVALAFAGSTLVR